MKSFVIASLALAAAAYPQSAAVVAEDAVPANAWTADAPQGYRVNSRLDQSTPGAGMKRKEVLYGPYSVPAGGMVTKYALGAEAPCKNCYVTAMQATIKHADTKKEALTSEGLWLHHTVLMGGAQMTIWAAGNERPTLRLNTKSKFGIDWPASYSMTVDLMSEAKEAKNLYLSVLFEFVDKTSTEGKTYKATYLRWNSIGNLKPTANAIKVYKSSTWTSSVTGEMLYTIGHMHDGGTDLTLIVNEKVACKSVMRYGGREGYGGAAPAAGSALPAAPANGTSMSMDDGHDHGHAKRQGHGHAGHGAEGMSNALHISDPGACTDFGTLKKGDKMRIEARYDSIKFPLMTHEGEEEAIMGNMRVYIGPTA